LLEQYQAKATKQQKSPAEVSNFGLNLLFCCFPFHFCLLSLPWLQPRARRVPLSDGTVLNTWMM
jgi:hypothetical protein